MKHKLPLTMAIAGACALASVSANANTITVGQISSGPDGSGGVLWTYSIVFINSTVSSTQPTSFNLNDFGPLKTTGPLASGFSFSPGVTFTVTTPLVGPNFGLPGFQPNNPAVADVVITFTGNANMGLPQVTFDLVLDTDATETGGLANFFSQDIVQGGTLNGTTNAVQQNIIIPAAGIPPDAPDGGTTCTLLGIAFAGLAALRRRLTA